MNSKPLPVLVESIISICKLIHAQQKPFAPTPSIHARSIYMLAVPNKKLPYTGANDCYITVRILLQLPPGDKGSCIRLD